MVFESEAGVLRATKGYREERETRKNSKEMNRREAQREARERKIKARLEMSSTIEWNNPLKIQLDRTITPKAINTKEESLQPRRLESRYSDVSLFSFPSHY